LTSAGFNGDGSVRVSVVVLAFGEERLLEKCIESALGERDVEVVLVDNGCVSDAVDRLEGRDGLRIVRPGRNTGFAEGCNLGVANSRGEFVVLLNSDAVARPGALAALVSILDDPTVGISTASVRLLSNPERLNSSGNPVHYVGLTWAGNLGEVAANKTIKTEVAGASGAAMAVRRRDWDDLQGFFAPMFAYYEDVEFSLRTWLAGRRVVYVPAAEVWHDYSFSRNRRKYFLLERNRLLMVLTLYQARTLAVLALPLLGFEIAMLATAMRAGWLRQKLRSYWWLVAHASMIVERRRVVQKSRKLDDTALVPLLTAELDPGPESGIDVPAWAVGVSRVSWRVARLLLPNGNGPSQRFEADTQNSL
jgi:GT2 family glycosyltransferase